MSQQEAIEAINSGKNVFLSGPGGVGKSWTIDQVADGKTVTTAQTAIAARNVSGETLNSLFGLPFGISTEEEKNKITPKLREVFGDDYITKLVFDEISTVRADKLDVIDHKLRLVKRRNEPFGGVQTIFSGDLWQIPSIVAQEEKKTFRRMYRSSHPFSSNVWKEMQLHSVELTEVMRNTNKTQVALLNAIRTKDETLLKGKGTKLWQEAIVRLNQWAIAEQSPDQLHLCCYRDDAQKLNDYWYNKLTTKERVYFGKTSGDFDSKTSTVDQILKLKVGVKVVFSANDKDKNYLNGDYGIVEALEEDAVHVRKENGDVVKVSTYRWEKQKYSRLLGKVTKIVTGTFNQLPLRLGYGLTIHSCQGMTLDKITLDLGRGAFQPAMLYVAASRVRNLQNISLTRPVRESDLIIDTKVKKYYDMLAA